LAWTWKSERHGFNYDDSEAVKKQLEKLREEVLKYRNHPALLAWGIGNELNLHYKNPKVWNAVNDISRIIHTLDTNHLVTTVLAGVNKNLVDNIKERAPDIDLLSINTYGGLATLPVSLHQAGWNGAYMVTEWGPTGQRGNVCRPPGNLPLKKQAARRRPYTRAGMNILSKMIEKNVWGLMFSLGTKSRNEPLPGMEYLLKKVKKQK
jgi:hypothetical protein